MSARAMESDYTCNRGSRILLFAVAALLSTAVVIPVVTAAPNTAEGVVGVITTASSATAPLVEELVVAEGGSWTPSLVSTLQACQEDHFFRRNPTECLSIRERSRQRLEECDSMSQGERDSCENRYTTQQGQERCNDSIVYGTEILSCQDEHRQTEKKQRQCQDVAYYLTHKYSCEDNEPYALQLTEEKCDDAEFYYSSLETQRACEKLKYAMEAVVEKCEDREYYRLYQQVCENHRLYLRRGQERCGSDEAFQSQHPRTCENQRYYAIQQEERCRLLGVGALGEQRIIPPQLCEENSHYFYKQHLQSCKGVGKEEWERKHCTQWVSGGTRQKEKCDSAEYYGGHRRGCDILKLCLQGLENRSVDEANDRQRPGPDTAGRELMEPVRGGDDKWP